MKKSFLSIILLLCLALPVPRAWAEWREVTPGSSVHLPRDLYFREDYRIQWWYLTGHVFDDSGREFGYELTFFSAGVQRKKYESPFGVNFITITHFAVSDVSNKRFLHFSDADSGAFGFAGADERQLNVHLGKTSLSGSLHKMNITARAGDVELALSLVPKKPVVLQGEKGYSRKAETSPLNASLYFSLTDLETRGTLKTKEGTFSVAGKSWFDRELASRGLAENEAGWDWFALQLDDDREVMLYRLRKRDGSLDPYSSGTVVYTDGTYRHLTGTDFTVAIRDHYTSKHTGARYPSKWEVAIPSEQLDLTVTPLIEDQEFTEAGAIRNLYWEGTCRVEGSVGGRAYVEMTGY
jgi:predicted secreted hydrolase